MYTLVVEYDYMSSWYDFPYEWKVYAPDRYPHSQTIASGSAVTWRGAIWFAKRKIRRHAEYNKLDTTFALVRKYKQ